MGNPRKRQLDHDQQFDNAEIESDQRRAGVQQEELARREPTSEDEYFFKQERERSAEEKQEKEERARLKSVRSAPIEKVSDGILGRLYRALIRHSDTKWRP